MAICASCGQENPEGARFCNACAASLDAGPVEREQRKTVTIVFCDVTGSTELGESTDPEALRGLLARYFERMKGIVESHGGSVEKFIGDAVMAVFGVPVVHEDDALRACRAAVEMREALPELGVEGRIGVMTGEVVTGTRERLATGDAVNVAARLEQAAEPGEVLIGQPTLALVGDGVEVEPLEPLELKGKGEPVPAYRLLRVRADALEPGREARFIGRERELMLVREVWERVRAERRCELVTVVGDAGVGKSRLVAEFLVPVEATIVRGRCLPYGEGITYWPVVEVLKQLELLATDEVAALVIRSLLGESEAATSAEEIAWAFRKTLEQAAAERPLVVVFDDLQWGEETLRDLLEHVALLSSGASVLLLCMARPELTERHPAWPVTLWLEPLADDEVEELIAERVSGRLRDRIARAAGGNPLFVEEMLAMAGEADGEVVVPPTLRALLAARLDQLDPAERSVLERGAVEGEVFHRSAVQALAPEETQVTPRLAGLVRKRLIRSDRALLPGEDAFRFRHLLIRDAAYDALPKATRADLHRRFAAWLEQHGESLAELDEILGYHLEQASRYLDELGRPDQELALAAGDRLALAGKRADRRRGDFRAAASLLERALALRRPHRFDVHLELDLAQTLYADLPRAVEAANAAAARAEAAEDRVATALARTFAAKMRLSAGHVSTDETERLAHEALPLLEAADDDEGLVHVWMALEEVANQRARFEDWAKAAEQAIAHARAVGPDNRLFGLEVALQVGPRPASEALDALEAVLPEQPHPISLLLRARLLAMLDRIEEAWAAAHAAHERARELGIPGDDDLAEVAAMAGDDEAAAAYLRVACDANEASGHKGLLAGYAPRLGRCLCALGRYDEAEPLAQQGRELTAPDDVLAQVHWRQTQALVHAARGQHAEAERLAREAVTWAERSDSPGFQGDALYDLGEVLEAAGRRDDATAALREALDRYERKGIIPLARRVRERLAAIQPTGAEEPTRTLPNL